MAAGKRSGVGVSRFPLKRLLVFLLVLFVAAAGHLAFWYAPRERAAAVDGDSLPAQLLLQGELPYRLWLPYPHQNLARLWRTVADAEGWMAAVTRLLGSSGMELPRFGPFRFPPSRSLTIASDREGARVVIAVEVYPIVARVARLAGRIAGNDLLSGGRVSLDGRPFEVSWRQGTWLLRSSAAPEIEATAFEPLPEALAWLVLRDGDAALPPGRYALRRQAEDLILSSFAGGDAPRGSTLELIGRLRPELRRQLAFLGLRDGTDSKASWMLMLRHGSERWTLPEGAVLYADPSRRWSLPGERLARWLDLHLESGQIGPWGVVAMTARSFAAAEELGSAVEQAGLPAGIEDALWVRPALMRPLVETVRQALEAVPVVSRKELQYWHDLSVALAPILSFETISFETAQPAGAELRLWSQSPWVDAAAGGALAGDKLE